MDTVGDMITLKRVKNGVTQHFQARACEWLMLYPALAFGTALNIQREMFSLSSAFDYVALWISEVEWSVLWLTIGAFRLFALVINGTFKAFPYSPHIRIAACLVSGLGWTQFVIGFGVSAANGASWAAAVICSTFILAEGLNIYRASGDLWEQRAARRFCG